MSEDLRSAEKARISQLMLDAIGQALIATDVAGTVTFWNAAAERLYGWSALEAIGRSVAELTVPEMGQEQGADILAALVAGESWTGEFTVQRRDGTRFPAIVADTGIYDDSGDIIGLIGVSTDLTEIRKAEAALTESEARYRLIAETAQEGIWATSPGGDTLYANQKMADLLGLSLPDFYGQPFWELVTGSTRKGFLKRTRRREKHGSEKYDVSHIRPDGSARILQMSVSPFPDGGSRHGSLAMVSDITDARNAEDELRHRASHDPLTGLASRALLLDGLQTALDRLSKSESESVAVLVADIDEFKLVNDSFGHASGDALLIEVSRRWQAELGHDHLLARFGGDEFVVLCRGAGEEAARDVAARLLQALNLPVLLAGGSVAASASIGIAAADAAHPCHAETLVRYADAAMYEAKARGRSRTEVFTPSLIDRAQRRLQLFNDLKVAISHSELTLHYQPIVKLDTGELLGVEALCRWNHPQLGAIAPDEFIAAAESGGLIESLDRWVLLRACSDAAALRAVGVLPLDGYVSINTSAASLARPDYEAGVQIALDESALPAAALVLEVTESAVMTDPDAARRVLESLRTLGVRIAIDDFGTGYSSLAYLRRFPVGTLKIDRGFVSRVSEDPEDRAIVAAVIDLATALSVTTTAEGIETSADLALLRQLGCHAGQGFLWSPALPPEQLTALIRQLPHGRFAVQHHPKPHSPRPLPLPRTARARSQSANRTRAGAAATPSRRNHRGPRGGQY